MGEVVAVVLRDLEGLVADTVVQVLGVQGHEQCMSNQGERQEGQQGARGGGSPKEPGQRARAGPRHQGAGPVNGKWELRGALFPMGVSIKGADPQQLLRQVPALVDAPVHGHEALQAWLVSDVGVVEAGVEHDDGEGQHVAGVCGEERESAWEVPVTPHTPGAPTPGPHLWIGRPQGCTGSSAGQTPPSCGRSSGPPLEAGSSIGTAWGWRGRMGQGLGGILGLHPPAFHLPRAPCALPQCLHQVEVGELMQVHEGVEHCQVQLLPGRRRSGQTAPQGWAGGPDLHPSSRGPIAQCLLPSRISPMTSRCMGNPNSPVRAWTQELLDSPHNGTPDVHQA